MRVLITGGAGYLGSVLSRYLLERGYDVTVLDAFVFGEEPINDIKDRIKIVKSDLRKANRTMVEGADVVIDAAAISNDPAGNLDERLTLSINYEARSNFAKLCKKVHVKKYIAPASCAIYGISNGLADEKTPPNPLTAYARANMLWEKDILAMADKNFCVTVFRQATLYGFSYKIRFDLLVNTMTLQLFRDGFIELRGTGGEYRPFLHVQDDCVAFSKVIESEDAVVNKQIFNVGSNEQNLPLRVLAENVAKSLGFENKCKFGTMIDKRNYEVNFEKIAKTLNFKPKYTIEDGAKEIYKAIQDGRLDYNDPRTMTVEWYKHLINTNQLEKIFSTS